MVIRADPNQSLTSGSFTEALGYSIQCFHPNQGNSGNQNFDEQNFTTGGPTVNVSVSSSARFTTASAADIDFGNFSQTTAKTVVTIQSTSNYDLTVSNASKSSQGQAALVLNASGSPVGSNALIPYSMKFNNTAIPASGTLLNQPRVGTTGQQFDFLLDIGSLPAGKLSGTYRDVITLTLVPR